MPPLAAPTHQPVQIDDARLVTTALLRAARAMGLSQDRLARTIGVSPATISRAAKGQALISPGAKEGELSLLVLRVYRSLMSLVGDSTEDAQKWMQANNRHLGDRPEELITRIEGLGRVVEYLDALRAKN